MLPLGFAMPLIWREKRGLSQECLLPPPPKVPRHSSGSGSSSWSWSIRMHEEDTQGVCPFRLVRALPKDYMAPWTSKARPAANGQYRSQESLQGNFRGPISLKDLSKIGSKTFATVHQKLHL